MQLSSKNDQSDLILFFVLTIFLSYTATRLPMLPDLIQLFMVFIPALLATLIAWKRGGWPEVRMLFHRSFDWKRPLRWYLLAVGLAFSLRLFISLTALLLGWISAIQMRPWSPVQMIAFAIAVLIFAQLEEIGWRGYALPRLLHLPQLTPLMAALLIGVLWGAVHVSLTLPGMTMQTLSTFVVLGQIIGLSLIITWLFLLSKGSVMICALFHGGQSFLVVLNEGISLEQNGLLVALVFTAVGLVAMFGYEYRQRRQHQQRGRQKAPAA